MSYEKLLREADHEGIEIYENNYIGKLKGLYVDNTITINTNITSNVEKRCILIEELGHYYTSYGDIRDQSKLENRKQENRARAWGYEKLISILDIINAYKNNITNRYELAEYLNVTEEFIEDAIDHYHKKYGQYCKVGIYVVYFNPLAVMEVWE